MLVLTIINTVLLAFLVLKVVHVEKQVVEAVGSLDGIKRLLIAIFTKKKAKN